MAKRQRPELNLPADLVWAAACAAYRVNGGYLKYADSGESVQTPRPANRDLVRQYVADEQLITRADHAQGARCRQDLVNATTMAALKNQATEWDMLAAQMATLDRVTTEYELSVIAAMPKSHTQILSRAQTDSRLAQCATDAVGRVNESVILQGEVVRCNYSAKWNTFYSTVITHTNHQVFFAYRERLRPGSVIAFRGRVKRHADSATQLSRVKILEQEVV